MLIQALRNFLPRHAQTRYLVILLSGWLLVFALTRIGLLFLSQDVAELSAPAVLKVFAVGTVYDLSFLLYTALFFAAYLLLWPKRWWGARWHQIWLRLLFGISLFAMLFIAVSEYLFWDEFGVRFNFIAVDYLVYSKEVVNNVLESYPVYAILAAIGLLAVVLTTLAGRFLKQAVESPLMSWRRSFAVLGSMSLAALGVSLVVGQDSPRGTGGNAYQRELGSNGPYQFFAAFRNNEIDYDQFYAGLPLDEVGQLLRDAVAEPNARFIAKDPLDIRRVIDNPGAAKSLNVILVTIESLSAKYLGSFGDLRGLTPNLDKLRNESLFFSQFYATGTRTDRGLEAITLSIPPTPGRSIVKRIGRESGYASLGYQFQQRGYDTAFVYGGRGYFDNMNAFFSGNGYRIVDQASVPAEEMQFENAWGMSDEDLYRQTVKLADIDHAAQKPFFLQLMTTSNHRPYTYPEGRIDIPSGQGREGAVKYTDYAIGKFLDEARTKPWFAQTVFIFVADHNAGSAGKQDLPVDTYHIPLFIYAPAHIAPREVSTLASQIDLAPTLLGLLNIDYTSSFYGRNLLLSRPEPGRALIGNYQHLGLFDAKQLAILSPRRMLRLVSDAPDEAGGRHENTTSLDSALIRQGVAYYQGASYAFKQRLLGPIKP